MPKKPTAKQRRQYNIENLEKAIHAVRSKEMSVRVAAREFSVPKSTVSDHITGRVLPGATTGFKPVIPASVEAEIAVKIKDAGKMGFGLTRGQLCAKVGKLAQRLNIKTPFRNGVPGKDWLGGFLKRHPDISLRTPTPLNSVRARMLNPVVATKYFDDLGKVLADLELHDKPSRIWNIDETNVSLTHKPARVLAETGQKNVPGRVGNSREGITVLACINASGKDIPPLVVVKGQSEKSLRAYNLSQGPADCKYTFQKKAWMEDVLGVCWFRDHFLRHCGPDRPQLIILDSHSSHETLTLIEEARANNIALLALPPHTTQYLNPLDKTVFGPFQREYNRVCSDFMSQSPNNQVTKWEWPRLFKSAYLKTLNPENITKGFEVCGIYPFDAERVPKAAYAPSKPFDTEPTKETTSVPVSPSTPRVPVSSTSEATLDTSLDSLPGPLSSPERVPQGLEAITVSLPVTDVVTEECTVVASAGCDGLISLDDPQALFDLIVQGDFQIVDSGDHASDESVNTLAVDQTFSLPCPVKNETKQNKRKITSHRLLTSDEVIDKKRKEQETKEELARQKEERKLIRQAKAEQKQEKKNKKVQK